MTEMGDKVIDFEAERKKRDNPEGIVVGDICHLRISGNKLSLDKVLVVSVSGNKADVRLLVGLSNNIDGLAWYKLDDGTDLSMNFTGMKTIDLKNLKKVEN